MNPPGLDAPNASVAPIGNVEPVVDFKGTGTGGVFVGVVSEVRDNGEVLISQQETNGIKQHEELEVLRPNPEAEGQWVRFARVSIISVSPTSAVARVVASTRELTDGNKSGFEFEKVQVGNKILRATRTAKPDEAVADTPYLTQDEPAVQSANRVR